MLIKSVEEIKGKATHRVFVINRYTVTVEGQDTREKHRGPLSRRRNPRFCGFSRLGLQSMFTKTSLSTEPVVHHYSCSLLGSISP